mmetsp:Transcript_40203/g.124227  ORF Transcript_40203/g.124227 Transcript_40203/m.124227 type:complete len:292 (+) Transcript_40203:428-1303(+)
MTRQVLQPLPRPVRDTARICSPAEAGERCFMSKRTKRSEVGDEHEDAKVELPAVHQQRAVDVARHDMWFVARRHVGTVAHRRGDLRWARYQEDPATLRLVGGFHDPRRPRGGLCGVGKHGKLGRQRESDRDEFANGLATIADVRGTRRGGHHRVARRSPAGPADQRFAVTDDMGIHAVLPRELPVVGEVVDALVRKEPPRRESSGGMQSPDILHRRPPQHPLAVRLRRRGIRCIVQCLRIGRPRDRPPAGVKVVKQWRFHHVASDSGDRFGCRSHGPFGGTLRVATVHSAR